MKDELEIGRGFLARGRKIISQGVRGTLPQVRTQRNQCAGGTPPYAPPRLTPSLMRGVHRVTGSAQGAEAPGQHVGVAPMWAWRRRGRAASWSSSIVVERRGQRKASGITMPVESFEVGASSRTAPGTLILCSQLPL